jgi:hypothetical protein
VIDVSELTFHGTLLARRSPALRAAGVAIDLFLRLIPDGHIKFPHLWPLKLLQAGRWNY